MHGWNGAAGRHLAKPLAADEACWQDQEADARPVWRGIGAYVSKVSQRTRLISDFEA